MKKFKLYLLHLIIALSITINYSWAESVEELYLESKNLLHESRFDAKKLDIALEKINQVIKFDIKNIKAYRLRAEMWLLKNDYKKTEDDVNIALKLDPDNANTISQLAAVKYYQGQIDEAFSLFDKAIFLDENNIRAFQNRGFLFYLQKQYKKSLIDFNKALKINPEEVYTLNNRAVLHYELGNHEEALADFKKVEKLDPNSPVPSYYQGLILEKKGDITAAAEKYRAAISIAKNLPLYPTYTEAEIALERVSTMITDQGS